MTEERLESAGDLKIFVRTRRPDGAIRDVMVTAPGFNSHSADVDNGLVIADIKRGLDARLGQL